MKVRHAKIPNFAPTDPRSELKQCVSEKDRAMRGKLPGGTKRLRGNCQHIPPRHPGLELSLAGAARKSARCCVVLRYMSQAGKPGTKCRTPGKSRKPEGLRRCQRFRRSRRGGWRVATGAQTTVAATSACLFGYGSSSQKERGRNPYHPTRDRQKQKPSERQ
jgi:hypothetical protein